MIELSIRECGGGVTAPKDFVAGGLFCGIRKVKKDLAIIRSLRPSVAAGVFTLNETQAAPVVIDKELLKRSPNCSVIVANSGNANACTGERGMNDGLSMVNTAAQAMGVPAEQVLISSTGVIGQFLPIEKITEGIKTLAGQLTAAGSSDAAEAIMTTDTYPKEMAVKFTTGGTEVTIGGIAKGSGMIAPNMATMLAFLTTDASITPEALNAALKTANEHSFNRITVDGDMSTNDMALILANGAAENSTIQPNTPELEAFTDALEFVMIRLAKMIVRDGEGATKLVEISVSGARTEEEAVKAAKAVANSNLVKTAIHGADANWGRILAAVGYSGISFDPANVGVKFDDVPVLNPGYIIVLDEEKAKQALSKDSVRVSIELNQGDASALFWTCDLSKEYVHINASYRS